jgi:outer membrane protein OmpA-like peptidoglycan-associated protein
LHKSPVSHEQATKAIAEAKAHVDEAFLFGQEEGATRDTVVATDSPPVRVHFAFNSSALTAEATNAVSTAAAYMAYRPESVVQITGHTDPIGSDGDNQLLGQARADSVASALRARGVEPGRVTADSMGEKALVTADPKQYSRDRRADFGWASDGAASNGAQPSDEERSTLRAMTKAQERADTELVLRFVPRTVEERAGGASVPGGNAELPEWHWGQLDASFRGTVDDWIRSMVGTKLESALDGVAALDTVTETVPITGTVITVNPRDRAKEIVRALMAAPTQELGNLMGETPGP